MTVSNHWSRFPRQEWNFSSCEIFASLSFKCYVLGEALVTSPGNVCMSTSGLIGEIWWPILSKNLGCSDCSYLKKWTENLPTLLQQQFLLNMLKNLISFFGFIFCLNCMEMQSSDLTYHNTHKIKPKRLFKRWKEEDLTILAVI